MQEFLKRQLGESVSSLEVEVLQNTILPSYIEKWVLGIIGVYFRLKLGTLVKRFIGSGIM